MPTRREEVEQREELKGEIERLAEIEQRAGELIRVVDNAVEILTKHKDLNVRSVALGLKLAVESIRPLI